MTEEIKLMIKDGVYSEDGITYMSDKQYNNYINIIKQLQKENKQLKDKLIEINEVINGYMPNQYAMCKAFDEIEFYKNIIKSILDIK